MEDGGFHSCRAGHWGPSLDPCPCYPAARTFIGSSLELLAGDRGELCRQWRSFKLITTESRRGMQVMGRMDEVLRYPTPILTKVVLKGLSTFSFSHSNVQLFPDAPVLKKVTVLDCDNRSAPNFGNAADVEIGSTDRRKYIKNTQTLNPGTIQRLSLWLMGRVFVQFPSHLPTLRVLELAIDTQRLPNGLLTCEMPQLSSLSLGLSDFSTLYELFNCRGIDLSRLKELTLNLERRDYIMDHFLSNAVVRLLEQAHSLEYLYANEDSLTPILEILKDAQGTTQASGLLRGVCVVNLDTNDRIVIKEGDTEE